MTRWLAAWIAVAVIVGAHAIAASAASIDLDAAQIARYHALNQQLRCLICQNRSIAQSDAPLAYDLKAIVAQQIAAGRSDAQIKQYLVDRYGQWVLYDPPFKWSTWLLWLGPFALLALGLAVVAVVLRRRGRADPGAPRVDRERLARVLEEYEAGGAASAVSGRRDRQ